ncbi:hypothetical protein EWM64_g4795 [Hericium alpestre]|uniref:Uncharacterized protein n=1 Tax=Hericium alpestre TaxID=135208 RepID=A0A4Y9ZYE1_9AGAM|nr:hypothetical protein EWM64_g4795 [Hericium alpestre]
MAAGAADIQTLSARTHDVDDVDDLRALPLVLRLRFFRPRDLEQLRGVPREQPDLGHGGLRDVLNRALLSGVLLRGRARGLRGAAQAAPAACGFERGVAAQCAGKLGIVVLVAGVAAPHELRAAADYTFE